MTTDDFIATQVTPLPCWDPYCQETFMTFTALSNHHYRAHERPVLDVSRAVWEATVPSERYRPPNWKQHNDHRLSLNGQRSTS